MTWRQQHGATEKGLLDSPTKQFQQRHRPFRAPALENIPPTVQTQDEMHMKTVSSIHSMHTAQQCARLRPTTGRKRGDQEGDQLFSFVSVGVRRLLAPVLT